MITLLLLAALALIQAVSLEIYSSFYVYNRNSFNQIRRPETEPLDRQERIARSNRLFLPDGTIHLEYRNYGFPEDQRVKIYDTNDNLIWQGKDNELPEQYLQWPGSLGLGRYYYAYSLRLYRAVYPDPRRSVIIPVLNGREIESLWRYEVSDGYFAGFDTNGNRIGYCGSTGFVQEQSRTKPLGQSVSLIAWTPIQGGGPVVLWLTEHSIYQIDFRKQSLEPLIQLPDKKITEIKIHGWTQLAPDGELYLDNKKYRPLITCKIDKNSIIAILRDPAETIQIDIPEKPDISITNITATREKIYLRAIDSGLNPPKELARNSNAYVKWIQERLKNPIERTDGLYEVNSAGGLTLLNKFEWTSQPIQRRADSRENFRRLLSKTSPPFYDISGRLLSRLFGRSLSNYNRDLYELFMTFLHFTPSYNPVSYLLSALMAGIVFFHAWPRRTSTTNLIGWIIFAALFNIVGLLVYLALNYTPTIRCHKCNKHRGLNTPECPNCGADLHVIVPDKLNIIDG